VLLRLDLAAARDPDPAALAALEQLFGCKADNSVQGSDRAVCACFKVVESEIRSAVADGATLAQLQKDLKCGTNCGSCVPELRRLLSAA
jgi:assimilatory nitrate reductase catalytic subunit